jgi:hypothetical protein
LILGRLASRGIAVNWLQPPSSGLISVSDNREPCPVAATSSQGIAEGAMNGEMTASLAVGDDVFRQFMKGLVADFATKFDEWLVRVQASSDGVKAASPDDELVSLKTPSMSSEHVERRRDRSRVAVELVYDLARLCRNFVWGDLWAWGFLQLRHGSTTDDAIRSATERATQSQIETHDRKWNVGLRAIDGSRLNGYWTDFYSGESQRLEGTSWVPDVWTVVVDETISSYLEECLKPALEKHDASSVIEDTLKVIEKRSQRIGMTPADFVERLRERKKPVETMTGGSTAPRPHGVTPAVLKWRRKTVRMYRMERDQTAADLARHVGMDESAVRAIIREDRRASRCTDLSRDSFLAKLGISLNDWYAPRD